MAAMESVLQWESQVSQADIVQVPVRSLRLADSPRLSGEDSDHVRVLADSADSLPPILVHRSTMQVIDGMHRLRATLALGGDKIAAQFLDCAENDIFVVAVQANTAHGLPLSLADRKKAAARIVELHPEWSDRLIATAAGLSHKTVSTIRRCATGDNSQLHTRAGYDGRIRPLNSAEGRKIAAELLRSRPTASLREVARAAGISPGTVRDVRARLERDQNPVPYRHARRGRTAEDRSGVDHKLRTLEPSPDADATDILQKLKNDPALRFSESGRAALRQLHACTLVTRGLGDTVGKLPAHSAIMISKLARVNAKKWQELACQLEKRAQLSAEQ